MRLRSRPSAPAARSCGSDHERSTAFLDATPPVAQVIRFGLDAHGPIWTVGVRPTGGPPEPSLACDAGMYPRHDIPLIETIQGVEGFLIRRAELGRGRRTWA